MTLFSRRLQQSTIVESGVVNSAVGTMAGVALVALLVPILSIWNGSGGPFGQSIPLFFLVPVLIAAAASGLVAGVIVAVVAILAWDWFFIPPVHTVTITSARDVTALIVFLAVAALTGQLATIARRQTHEALQRAHSSEALYDLSSALIGRADVEEVLSTLAQRLRSTFNLRACAVLLPNERSTGWRTASIAGELPAELRVETSRDLASTATWVAREGRRCGLGRQTLHVNDVRLSVPSAAGQRVQLLPLRIGTKSIGVLEVVYPFHRDLSEEAEHLLETMANGVALALEQERLSKEEREAEVARESDRLKTALLSSVSHDLRTPLAGIKAAASSLLQDDIHWSGDDRRAFLIDIDTEADRLTRLVSNLLDLSRIEAGAIQPVKEWEDVGELINRVVHRLRPQVTGHPIATDIPEGLPYVQLDAVQIEQVLTNLIENASKYSPTGAEITASARVTRDAAERPEMRISVADHGAGIPASERQKIFGKFYRVAGQDRRIAGTGMGLAIVKGLVEAHGGRIEVDGPPGEGSTFTVTLPASTPMPPADPASLATVEVSS